MAGPLNTGQEFATYLLFLLIRIMIYQLVFLAISEDPMLLHILAKTLVKTTAWSLRGHPRVVHPKKTKCFKKTRKRYFQKWNFTQNVQDTTIKKLPSYLVPAFFVTIKVGCCIEAYLRKFMHYLQRAPRFLALQSAFFDNPAVQFDSDSFSIGIDNHASRCMANAPHLFEDLQLTDNAGEVKGIGDGTAIEGKRTFKFSLEEDQEKIHTIKIPNSLYLPGLKQCLLSPQHWAQEAGDWQTWMGNFERMCVLHWHVGGKKTVFFDPSRITPILTAAPTSRAYRAFAMTFKALEAPYYHKETVLQYPGRQLMNDAPEEFIAEENLNFEKVSVDEGVNSDVERVKTSNLPAPPKEEIPSEAIRQRPLTFDPSPPQEEGEHVHLAAANNQAELMRWHYRLGHLTFPKPSSLPSMVKYPRSWQKSRHPSALAASSAR
jgi:hypothetical protein